MSVTLSRAEARRYLLHYHRLLPARSLGEQAGVRSVMTRLRCIQVDPLDVVGRNVHLVMQSRVRDFKPALRARNSSHLRSYGSLNDGKSDRIVVEGDPSWQLRTKK
ncbi:MAG: hypothetical protein ACOC7V_08845 [Spirochaetota bacterium]